MGLIDERVSVLSMKWPYGVQFEDTDAQQIEITCNYETMLCECRLCETLPLLPLNEDDFWKSLGTKIHIGSHPMCLMC